VNNRHTQVTPLIKNGILNMNDQHNLKLSTDTLPWSFRVISTANRAALAHLAELFAQQDYDAIRQGITQLDPQLAIIEGVRTEVSVDIRQQPSIHIVLPVDVLRLLAVKIQELAGQNEDGELHLSLLVPSLVEASKFDWTVRVQEWQQEPDRDYQREPLGAMWEAVLFHEPPSTHAALQAWDQLRRWAASDEHDYPNLLSVRFHDGERDVEEHSPHDAFALLCEERVASQISGWQRVPFHHWYGEARDWIQVWVETDRTMLIVHDRHAETGSRTWDIDNFFMYRDLILRVAHALQAEAFVWGIEAESYGESARRGIDTLHDTEALWDFFTLASERDRSDTHTEFEATARRQGAR
jgi:hypothetical protein